MQLKIDYESYTLQFILNIFSRFKHYTSIELHNEIIQKKIIEPFHYYYLKEKKNVDIKTWLHILMKKHDFLSGQILCQL